jgi:8-oxo-dGTP pyrophosphatase MutT (NUDIX family)
MWDISAAGHVQAGDNPSTTALRELSEELGMKADAAELIHLGAVSHRHVDTSGTFRDNEFSEVFVLRRNVSLVKLSIQPEEVDEVAWCPAAMLPRRANRGDPSLVPHPEEYRILLAYLDQSN